MFVSDCIIFNFYKIFRKDQDTDRGNQEEKESYQR